MRELNPAERILAEAKLAFRRLLLRFPTWLLYFLSVLAFWPTTVLALCKARFCSKSYRRWDRISEGVILGAAPLWTDDVWRLKREENVTGVINCCREWDGHKSLYPRLGLIQLHLPTIDFFPPTYADCMRGAEFIHSRVARGESVYVHCKAGKGRSTTVVLFYLVLFKGMSPREADAFVRSQRPQISERWYTEPVQRAAALAKARLAGEADQ